MAYNYFADQNKELVHRRRTTRYDECFRKLPEEFKTQQFMEVFGCSQPSASKAITRFQNENIVEKIKYGVYKKVVSELP
jgi:Mn-dependent DtxR family transcriptional regulator